MIGSFSDKVLKRYFETGAGKGIDPKSRPRLTDILDALDAATKPEDMDLPGFAFHPLKGDRQGQFVRNCSGTMAHCFRMARRTAR